MIKFLVMDVDGTLTDGKIYMGNNGEEVKVFDIKDGCGIKELLPLTEIIPVVITARKSKMLLNRCEELGIVEIHQGVRKKMDCLEEIISKYCSGVEQYSLQNVAYIGDDILDLQCMKPILIAGGITGCPSDAVLEVKKCCNYIALHKGGDGAVRDFIEYIIRRNKNKESVEIERLNARLNWAVSYISSIDTEHLNVGRYEVNEGFYYSVQEYEALSAEESVYESHRKYIDIQWLISGKEKLYITDICNLIPISIYKDEVDIINYAPSDNMTSVVLSKGGYVVLFPKDAHRVEQIDGGKCKIRKIVGKLRI